MNKVSIILVLFFTFLSLSSFSQKIGNYQFYNLPQNNQLFPRDNTNQANISIKLIKPVNFEEVKLYVFKNKEFYQIIRPSLSGNQYQFDLTIPAELSEFDLSFFGYQNQGKDSVLLAHRYDLVAGDIILVSGQSNAKLGPIDQHVYHGEWFRTFGINQAEPNLDYVYPLGDTLWNKLELDLTKDPIKADVLGLGVGPFVVELARTIIESEEIPIAIITNAVPSSNMDFHLNLEKNYQSPRGGDILNYKVQKAGENIANSIKTVVFVQGEAEILANKIPTWLGKFETLLNFWKKEYPNLKRVAIPQLNVYPFTADYSARLRDEIRKMVHDQEELIGWATIGTKGFDGLHYYGTKYHQEDGNLYLFENEGYLQLAQEVGRLILKEVYGRNLPHEIYSPNIQKAYFFDINTRSKIALEFDKGQNLSFTSDTTVVDLNGQSHSFQFKNNFFYDAYNSKSMGPYIDSIKVEGNVLKLFFNIEYDGNLISYVPEFHQKFDGNNFQELYPYPGPYLKNSLGMRAFGFSNIKIIENFPYSDEFNLFPNPSDEHIEILWPATVNGTIIISTINGQEIFRKLIENTRYTYVNAKHENMSPGLYLISFISNEGNMTTKKLLLR